MADGASFLPRIESVFYAVFDEHLGPKIVHQVPEGLIATQSQSTATANVTAANSLLTSPVSPSALHPEEDLNVVPVSVLSSPALSRLEGRPLHRSPHKRGNSTNRCLFNFEDIAKYVIPRSALCGRVVKFATRNHRILGFPAQLKGKYLRNYFRYNLCFVFDKNADLSCYEPVVRKVSRVLTSCEEESAFLSEPQNSSTIHAILEQLYEDLNSYSETSIQIDEFNSIDIKIFPFYPNPPPVKDWQVPLALINLTRRVEPNWDLTVAKICQFIDGTNHVARIARLADCDIDLARQAVAHLLYYQVIMMIDIFQYSNMYTLRKNVQWLADEPHVREECGPYVRKAGTAIPDWPKLLHLYSRFKPGITVYDWMEQYDVNELGIDVRRFASFGVVKGFLRRVHRWPVLIEDPVASQSDQEKRTAPETQRRPERGVPGMWGRLQEALPTMASAGAEIVPVKAATINGVQAYRKASAAESSLEQFRTRDTQKFGDTLPAARVRGKRSDSAATMTTENFRRKSQNAISQLGSIHATPSPPRTSLRMSPDTVNSADMVDSEHSSGGALGVPRARLSRSPSAPFVTLPPPIPLHPPELPGLLDGEHHTDELCTRFSVGWPVLERWLRVIGGGGEEEGDFGQVSIIYR